MTNANLRSRGTNGFPVGADDLMKAAYGKIPDCNRFQNHQTGGFEVATEVHGWQWSITFRRWSALVTLADGWHGFSFPEKATEPMSDDEAFQLIEKEVRLTNNGKLLLANLPFTLRAAVDALVGQRRLYRTCFLSFGDAIRL